MDIALGSDTVNMSFLSEAELDTEQGSWLWHRRRPISVRPGTESAPKRPFSASRTASLHSLVRRFRIHTTKDTSTRKRKATSRGKKRALEDSFSTVLDRSLLGEVNARTRSPLNRQGNQTCGVHIGLRQRVKDLKEELRLKEEEIARMKRTIQRENQAENTAQERELKQEIAILRGKLNTREETLLSLENQLEAALQSADSASSIIRDLEQRQMQLEEQVEALKNRESEAERHRKEEIKALSEDLARKNEAWDQAKAEFTAQLYAASKALKAAEKNAKKKTEKIQIQYTKMNKLKEKIAVLERNISDLQGKEIQFTAEITSLKERLLVSETSLLTQSQSQQRLLQVLINSLGPEMAIVKKNLEGKWSECMEESLEKALAEAHISRFAVEVIKAWAWEDSGKVSKTKLADLLKKPENDEKSADFPIEENRTFEDPGLRTQMDTLFRHIRLRLQMSRMTIPQFVLTICPDSKAVEADQFKRQLRKAPIALTDPQLLHMLVLTCLKRPLTLATLQESVEQEWVGAERIREILQSNLGHWETFTQETETEFDQEIATAIAPVSVEFKAQCELRDSESCGYIPESAFLEILTNLHISFSENMLQYLKLLFYSLDQELDRVPYLAFLNAYISENGPMLPRSVVLQQQAQAILHALQGRKPRRVFAASVDGLITVAHFKAGLNSLEMWDLPESTFSLLVEDLQAEDCSGLSLGKLETMLGLSADSEETD